MVVPFLGTLAVAPVGNLAAFGHHTVTSRLWVHFYGVGMSALVATVAAVALTTVGARERDSRTVIVGGGFALMAALLTVHGLSTPGVILGNNELISVTGAATLPVAGAVMLLAALPSFGGAHSIRHALAVETALGVAIVTFSAVGALVPEVVPGVPAPRSTSAIALFAVGLPVYGVLGVRAMNTFLLTRRVADLLVVAGIALLAAALYVALFLSSTAIGSWLGHTFELSGIVVVGASLVYDLRRGGRPRTLVGDLRAADLVSAEETYLGARVRALMERLAEKDASTEEHTRRVAMLAVVVGEELGLSPTRLRRLAIGGLLHDIGKLSLPNSILQKPSSLDDHEYEIVKQHPQRGRALLNELGGFDETTERLVLDHHERLDGSGYPRGLRADDLALETRILAVCDVYDALVSPRIYRSAWAQEEALALLRDESGIAFDARCVEALELHC
jgi:HD-GYP domain-containing protein (c-di-GMP phosphodiesterase class II)